MKTRTPETANLLFGNVQILMPKHKRNEDLNIVQNSASFGMILRILHISNDKRMTCNLTTSNLPTGLWIKNGLDNINECPLGLLSFDGQNAPRLNILRGHLVSESVPMENGGNALALDFSRKAVFGYSNDNKCYVLRDVHGTNAIPFSQTFIQQKLQGESIIVANQRIDYNPSN